MPYLLLLIVATLACTGSPAQPDRVPKGEPFELRIGATALTTDDLSIRFDAVRSDSRCPAGAQCIWAGEAVIAVTLSRGGEIPVERELKQGEQSSTTFQGFTITFSALNPYPRTDRNTRKEDYIATFVVSAR